MNSRWRNGASVILNFQTFILNQFVHTTIFVRFLVKKLIHNCLNRAEVGITLHVHLIKELVMVIGFYLQHNFGGRQFYKFESLALIPIQQKLIEKSLLSNNEVRF